MTATTCTKFTGTVQLGISQRKDEQGDKQQRILSNKAKHLLADQRRLESVRKKEREMKKRHASIGGGWKLPKEQQNTKITFADSDSEPEGGMPQDSRTPTLPTSSSVNSGERTKRKGSLFEDADDTTSSDEGETDRLRFSKPQYSGDAGAKLLRLESRFGGDQRFKMDKQFLDEFQSAEKMAAKESSRPETISEVAEEAKKSLKVLGKVLGRELAPPSAPTLNDELKEVSSKTPRYIRYDPANPSHYKYDRSKTKLLSEHAAKMLEAENVSATMNESNSDGSSSVSESEADDDQSKQKEGVTTEDDRFFQMDTEFANSLRRRNASVARGDVADTDSNVIETEVANSFSLLGVLGKQHLLPDQSSSETASHKVLAADALDEADVQPTNCKLPKWQKQLIGVAKDSSDDSDSDSDGDVGQPVPDTANAEMSSKKTLIKKHPTVAAKQAFFLTADDLRVQNAIRKFMRRGTIEAVTKQWVKERNGLLQFCKGRRKEAIKAKRIADQQQRLGGHQTTNTVATDKITANNYTANRVNHFVKKHRRGK